MTSLAILKNIFEQRVKQHTEFGINDPELLDLVNTHQKQLKELEEILSSCEQFQEKIRRNESDEGKKEFSDALESLLLKYEIHKEESQRETIVSFAPEVIEKDAIKEETNEINFFPQITADQFAKVPAYMKGRLSLGEINTILTGMEEYMTSKAMILKKPYRVLKNADKLKVDKWREQDVTNCQGRLWMTESELKPSLSDRHKALLKNVLPLFRHLRITKEIREKKVVLICPYF